MVFAGREFTDRSDAGRKLADGGTMFLDEVGDMDLNLQAKLLRVLQEKEFYRVGGRDPIRVDVRIIAATHQNLELAVTQKLFREDLYYRLNVVPLYLPPLRERRDDIPLLIDYFLQRFETELSTGRNFLSHEAREILLAYHWGGNIRELENVMNRAMVLTTSSVILADRLEPLLQPIPTAELDEDPYVVGSNRIHPSGNRLFNKNAELIVVFLVYNPTVGADKQFDVQVDYHLYRKNRDGAPSPRGGEQGFNVRPGEEYVTRTNPQRFNPSLMGPRSRATRAASISSRLRTPVSTRSTAG